MDWDFGISRCKLLYIEWINNKVLLYSTGNYIQRPVKEYKILCVCVCVCIESRCCIPETNTTL